MLATRPLAAPLNLLAVLAVVVGLLAAVPAACWCPPDEHFGQILHPLFSHSHATDGSVRAVAFTDEREAASVRDAGSSWASAVGLGAGEWQGGVQILPPLASILRAASLRSRLMLDVARPAQHLPAPTSPPPR